MTNRTAEIQPTIAQRMVVSIFDLVQFCGIQPTCDLNHRPQDRTLDVIFLSSGSCLSTGDAVSRNDSVPFSTSGIILILVV